MLPIRTVNDRPYCVNPSKPPRELDGDQYRRLLPHIRQLIQTHDDIPDRRKLASSLVVVNDPKAGFVINGTEKQLQLIQVICARSLTMKLQVPQVFKDGRETLYHTVLRFRIDGDRMVATYRTIGEPNNFEAAMKEIRKIVPLPELVSPKSAPVRASSPPNSSRGPISPKSAPPKSSSPLPQSHSSHSLDPALRQPFSQIFDSHVLDAIMKDPALTKLEKYSLIGTFNRLEAISNPPAIRLNGYVEKWDHQDLVWIKNYYSYSFLDYDFKLVGDEIRILPRYKENQDSQNRQNVGNMSRIRREAPHVEHIEVFQNFVQKTRWQKLEPNPLFQAISHVIDGARYTPSLSGEEVLTLTEANLRLVQIHSNPSAFTLTHFNSETDCKTLDLIKKHCSTLIPSLSFKVEGARIVITRKADERPQHHKVARPFESGSASPVHKMSRPLPTKNTHPLENRSPDQGPSSVRSPVHKRSRHGGDQSRFLPELRI